MLTWGGTAALLLATVALVATGMKRQKTPPAPVRKKLANVEVVRLKAQEYREALTLPARIEADQRAVVSSEYPGRLVEWLVAEGAPVEEGEPVATIDATEARAQLAQADAQRTSSESAAKVAERQLQMSQLGLDRAQRDMAALDLELESAVADKKLAEREHTRIKTLADSGIGTGSDLDNASTRLTQAALAEKKVKDAITRADVAVESARVGVAEAEAGLALAQNRTAEVTAGIAALRVRLEKATLRSPLTGRLDEHLMEPGEYVGPGEPIAHVFDLSHVRAQVNVADRYAPFLDAANAALSEYIALAMPGAKTEIRVKLIVPGLPKLTGGTHAGLQLNASIVRISQAADPASNTFKVELRLPNPGEALREGLIGRAHIEYLLYSDAIVIPLSAVQVADVGPRVLVVEDWDGDGPALGGEESDTLLSRARTRDIHPVSIRGDSVLVGNGLAPGDRLVVSGGKGIIDGEEVNVLISDGVLQPTVPSPGTEDIQVPTDYRPAEPEAETGE